jgi:hypothetical protein
MYETADLERGFWKTLLGKTVFSKTVPMKTDLFKT